MQYKVRCTNRPVEAAMLSQESNPLSTLDDLAEFLRRQTEMANQRDGSEDMHGV